MRLEAALLLNRFNKGEKQKLLPRRKGRWKCACIPSTFLFPYYYAWKETASKLEHMKTCVRVLKYIVRKRVRVVCI